MESAVPLAQRKKISTGAVACHIFSGDSGANKFPAGAAAEFGG